MMRGRKENYRVMRKVYVLQEKRSRLGPVVNEADKLMAGYQCLASETALKSSKVIEVRNACSQEIMM